MSNKQFLTLIGVASVCVTAIIAIASCVKFVVGEVLNCDRLLDCLDFEDDTDLDEN